MSKITPLGEYILAQLNLNSCTLKSLEIGGNRSHYRATINWISSYNPQSDESKLQQVRNLLEAFHNLCEVGDLEKASNLFSMPIAHYVSEGLCIQLYIWGQYDELSATSLRLLELLNLNSKTNDKNFSLHVDCLRNLGVIEFTRGNCEASVSYYNQQLQVSIQHEDFKGRASALIGLGQNSIFLGKYSEANKYYLSAQDIASKLSDQKLSMSAKSGLGNIQIKLGQYELAIPYFQEQLKIAEELPDNLGKMQALADLGNAYSLTGDHETAVENHLNALKISHSVENPEGEAKILAHLGFTFYIQQEYRAAISLYKQSLTIARSIGLFLEESESLEKVGVLEGKLSNSPTIKRLSLDKLRLALDRFRKAGSLSGEARVLKEMAELYDELGEMEPALKACQDALSIARDLKLPLQDECIKLEAKLSNKKSSQKPSRTRTFREVDLNKVDWIKSEIDIVLLTATDIELNAVLDQLKPYPGKKEKFKIFEGPETYYVGKFGAFKAITTKGLLKKSSSHWDKKSRMSTCSPTD